MCICVYVCVLSHSFCSLVQGTVLEPVEFYQKVESDAGAWGKAVATIDASAARVFAVRWCQSSYYAKQIYAEVEGPDTLRKVVQTSSHSMLLVSLLHLPSPVSNRVFATWFTWRKEPDNALLIAFGPMEGYADQQEDGERVIANIMAEQKERREREGDTDKAYRQDTKDLELMMQQRAAKKELLQGLNDQIKQDPTASSAIRGTVRGYWRIKPLGPSVCEVTYIIQAELGGSIPAALLNARIKRSLGVMRTTQVKFGRNGKLVDKEMREAFASPPPMAELNDEQTAVFESCRYLESEDGSEWETLASPSPFVTMCMRHAPAKENERSIAIGKATAVIDCPVHEAVGESSRAAR